MKSIFLPRTNDDNPYQKELINHLNTLDIQADFPHPSSSTTFFLPAVLFPQKANILHLHWLHPFFAGSNFLEKSIKLSFFILELIILKLLRIKIIWTVHNLKNHENKNLALDTLCSYLVAKLTDAIIAHCDSAKEEVIKSFSLKDNQDKVFVVPHGNYINCYDNNIQKTLARKSLNIDDSAVVFLFLGMIRPYKGVLELIDTFKQLHHDASQLVIAGKVYQNSPEMTDLLLQRIDNDPKIKFIPGFIPSEKLQIYLNASDVVVFPYRDILTSGAVMLAMSFGRACIAPRKGCIAEVLDNSGAFLYDIDDEYGLIQAMKSALEQHTQLSTMGQYNRQLAEKYDWLNIAKITSNVYQSCM
ncbi:glycosyltransferase family 4 protein [Nostoc sp. FACHB-280]|uniref:glycosyltransferase family 4 protein n=1 Tax=Nostoc sp. FACHB-280 TaxID=2692839 RepID=UPI00168B1D17|nr:glycosyltransferase family 4 protein [Nostoc sp. FACHB-280]MBD2494039.1 glycosyltransferase family 4 protein [Nostoc sp. FACHB-280]